MIAGRSSSNISSGAQWRAGWVLEPNLNPVDEQLRRRRWRILRALLPVSPALDTLPPWIRTPDHFVSWLIGRMTPAGLYAYFKDLEEVAKQTCDLELFRLARRCRGRR